MLVDTTVGGTATAGDYTGLADGSLTFAPGETEKTLTAMVTGDDDAERDETVEVGVSLAPGYDRPIWVAPGGNRATGTGTIRNDDYAFSFGEGSNGHENHATDGNQPVGFKVVLNPAAPVAATVDYRTDDQNTTASENPATSGEDYEPASGTLTFAPGETEKTVEVTVLDDDLVEYGTKRVALLLSNVNGTGATIADANAYGSITSDDRYALSVDSPSVVEGGSGSTTDLEFTMRLSKAANFEVLVDTAIDGTATAGEDYTGLAAGRLTFAPGEAKKTLTATVTGDDDAERDETVEVRASLVNPYDLGTFAAPGGSSATGTGTIRNDEYEFRFGEGSNGYENHATEGNQPVAFEVVLYPAAPVPATVSYAPRTSGFRLATPGLDYETRSGSLTFAPGETEKTVEFAVLDDDLVETPEGVQLSLSQATASGVRITIVPPEQQSPRRDGYIIRSEDRAVLTVDSPSVLDIRGDSTADLTFTATLSKEAAFPVKVNYTVGGTATAGVDYEGLADGSLVFEPGETRKQLTARLLGDDRSEPDETVELEFTVTQEHAASTFVSVAGPATGTILNDLYRISVVEPDPVDEPAVGQTAVLEFGVNLYPAASGGSVTVDYQTVDNTATAGEDYVATSGTLTFAPGESEKTVEVVVNGDDAVEDHEVVTLQLSNPDGPAGRNVLIRRSSAGYWNESTFVGTILGTSGTANDWPRISIGSPSTYEGVAGETTYHVFNVTLDRQLDDEVEVEYRTTDGGTATRGEDFEHTEGTLVFGPGATIGRINVPIIGDDDIEPDETVEIVLDAPAIFHPTGAAPISLTGTGAIWNQDHRIRVNRPRVREGAPGTTTQLTFTVTLEPALTRGAVILGYHTVDGPKARFGWAVSAASDTRIGYSDFKKKNGRIRFTPDTSTQQFTVTVNGDSISERSEKVPIEFSVVVRGVQVKGLGRAGGYDHFGWIDDDDEFTYSMSANTQSNTRSVPEGSSATSSQSVPLYMHSNRQYYFGDGSCHADGGTATASVKIVTGGDYHASHTQLYYAGTDAYGVLDDTTSIHRCFIRIFGDDIIEEDETVDLYYRNAATGTGIGASNAVPMGTLTIQNDDHELSIDTPGADEGDTGAGELEFTVTLNPPSVGQVTVDYATGEGSATSGGVAQEGGDDYEPRQGTLTFEAGETSATIPVTVNGDTTWEGDDDETVEVTLSNPVGPDDSTIAHPADPAVGTIRHDDARPKASVRAPPAAVLEGGDLVFPVTLTNPSHEASTVPYNLGGTATEGEDYTDSGAGTATFAAGDTRQTISLATVADTDDEVDETVEVTLTDDDDSARERGAASSATGTITDDDMPALSIADATVTEGDTGESATLTFRVTLTPPATLPVTVDWETSDGTAEAGTDYTAANGSLIFETGEGSKTFTVTVTGDDADEPNETFEVTLSNAPGATLEDATATGTITDDDGPPALTLVLTPAAIGENGGESTVTATLDRPSGAATTVTVTAAPVDPAVAGDYTLTGSELTIPADSLTSTGEVTIAAVDNDVDDLDREVTVSGAATNAQGVTDPDDATLTITDDDAPELSIGDASVAEGDAGETATLTFTVTLTPAATLPVTVDWKTADGTATAGTDYTAANGSLTFGTGEESKTVTVTVAGDDADEPNETVTVTLSNAPGATITDATGTGTITDDDDAPTVTLVLTPAAIGENGGESAVSATLDRPSSEETTVTVSVAPVSPAVSGDYTLLGAQLTIAPGETTSTGELTITATDNDLDALDKAVTVSGAATNTQGITNPQAVTLTITDDDMPALSIADASVDEGDAGESATLTFTVTLTPAATLPVTVDWATADGIAEAGTDYTAATGSLEFGVGEATGTIAVTVTGDDSFEPNETFTVTLSNESGATITDGRATGTITNDDGPPAVTLLLTPAAISENGGQSTVTATLDRTSTAATTVTVSAAPVSPAVATDYTLVGSELTIAAGETASTGEVTITASDNEAYEGDKQVGVWATASNDDGVTPPQPATLTITEDDDAPELSIADASVDEGDSGSATLSFTVTLDPSAVAPVTVDWTTSDGTATAGTDYTAANGSLRFDPGEDSKTVTVTVTGDDADEPNETLTVTLSNESGATLGDATATGTITDDDDAPTVTLNLDPASITENGGKSTVTATLDRASSAATTVTVAVTPKSPAVAGDYTLSTNKTLTIAADSLTSTGVVTITAVNNDVDALDKEVTVSATATNTQGVTAPDSVTLTIEDDDAPALSVGDASVAEGDLGKSATLTFTVTLSPAATLPVTVDWKTADGTATAGTDYTAANGSLTFNTGEDTKTVTVTVTGDDADEPNETLTLTLTNESGATIADATGTGTITDDDDAPTVTLVLTPASITENGGKSTVTATLDRPSSAATTVTVSAAPVSPAVAGDYTLTGSQLTIAAGETTSTGEVTITAVNNEVDALAKEVTVSATATNSQGITAPQDTTLTITDDDAPSLSIGDASVTEGDDGESPTLTFTVTLAPAATLPVTVDWATADGTAEAGTDYTAGNGTLTFEAGEESKSVTVTVTGDEADEPNETFAVTLSNAPGATLSDATATGTITDDDDAPTVTLVLTPASIGENGGKSTVTATLDRASSAATTVTVTAAPVTPAVAGDYALSANTTLTIPADSLTSTGVVTITAVNNEVDALDKEVTVSATATNSQGITAPQDATLTIEDDDAPGLSIGDASVDEGDDGESATLTFTVTLAPAATLPVTVDWKTADGTAEAGTDYTAGNGTLTFNTGDESKTVTVTVTGDDADEPNETLTVTLTNESGATLGDATATGTITDDDDAPTVTLVLTPASITENGGESTVTATLDRPSSAATTVTVSAAPVSPAVANDYTLSTNRTLTIAADSLTSTGVVTITAVNNEVDALTKEVTVSATATNSQGITAPQNATLTITDDDAPGLSIGDAGVDEGDAGGSATLTFTVTLDPAATLPVTVDWKTADGTATAGTDYTAGSGSLRFDTGEDSKTVTVTVTGDDADEPNETLTVTLSNESGATLSDGTATGTITDDDAPTVTLVLTPASITENGGESTVTAALDRPSSAATTVTVSAEAVSPAVAGDYTLSTNRTLTIPADSLTSTGEVTITAVNNDVDALDREVTVSATAENDQGITAPQDATLTITDDDAPSLSIGDASVTEGDDGESPTLTFTVTLAPAATLPVTVDWKTADGTAEAGTDYTAGNGTLTFNTGDESKTVTVTVTGDDADEPNETLTVTLTNESGATLGDATATGTITDDDDAPTVTLALNPASITENGGESTVTATLDRPSSAATTVTVSAEAVSPAVAGDYTLSTNTTLTIPADSLTSTGVVTITAVNNEVDALDKQVTVSATAENDQGITTPQDATLTITDDDAPGLSIGDASVAEGDDGETATLTFTVTLAPAATLPVTVDWKTADGTAEAGTDYTAGNGTLTFNTGDESKTVTVTVTGDDADEPNETLMVTLSNAPGATLADATGTGTITDDDGPPAVTLVLTPALITENGGKSTVTATLDRASSEETTVTVSAEAVSPAVAGDYTLSADTTLTITAGATDSTGEVTITAADNTVYEGDKTVTVSATATNAQGVTAPQDATLTITEDDAVPVVTVAAETAEVTEGGDAVFILTRTGAGIATPLAVDFTLADPDAVLDREAPTTATIPANETTAKVTLATDDDATHEEDASLTLTLTDGDAYDLGSATSATVTVRDNDPQGQDKASDAAVTVAAETAEVTEGGDAVFTLTRTGDSTAELAVAFAVTGDLAALTDAPPTEATFAADADTVRVALATDDDTTDEPHATLTLTVTDGEDYYPGTPSEATVTVEDDDGPPTVTLVLTPASITENGGKSTVTATLDRPSSEETTVTVSAAPLSPAVANDYTLSTNRTLTIPADSLTSTGVVTITAVNNEVDALAKEVTVSATATNSQGITAPQNATLTITDDDAPSLSIGDASVDEGDAGGSATLTFTVTLDPAATLPVTVDWATSDGTATAGTDYMAGSGALTFETGDESKTITVTVTGDDADEPNETLTVTLSNESGATLGDATATGTITDDDDAPTVTLALDPASITENGGKSTVTATLDHPSSAATTVSVTAVPVSPAVSGDYALTGSQLTIAAGETTSTGAVTITAVNNEVDALDKVVTVSATATNSQGITAPQDATLTITDDDAPGLSIGNASVSEGDDGESATLTFTVTLDPAATLPVTVDWATSDGTAEAGTDYTAGSGSLRFDTGDETKTVTVTVTGDDADEPNETLTVTLSNESGATLGDATGTGTITDDDDAPTVTLVLTPATIGEAGGKSTVTATLDRASSAATTVRVTVAPVSPAVAGDYTLSTNKMLTIAAGQTTSTGVVTITAVSNEVDALDKEVTVSATATNSQGVTAPQDVTLTITDDDAPTLSIGDASVGEGDEGDSPTLTFTVTLSPAATLPVTVDWATSDGTATAGTDYTAANGSLTFNTGDETKTITVTVTGDDADEPNETLTVTLTNESGATLGDATGTGTITDDDGPPTVTLVLTPASIGENGGKSTVTATLDHPSSQATTVTVTAAPVSPSVAGDYTLSTNKTLTIAAGQTTSTGVVTITAVSNEVDALDKEVTVSATAANDQGVTNPQAVTLTITDDDAPALSIGDASVGEGDLGDSPTLTFTVTLTPAATLPVTVDWATSDGTATAGTDYTAGNGSLTFDTGDETKTITVTVTGDDADEPNERFTVTLSNAPGATLRDATGTGTITDDDDAPTVTLVLTPATIGENGGKSTVTATLDRESSEATTVTVAVTPKSPAVAGDYTLSTNKTLTIAAGATTSTGVVTITAVNNEVDALDKEVMVSATATNSQGVTAPQDATLTITDDDAPTLSIGDASVNEGDSGTSATLTFTVTLTPAATLPVTVDWATSDGTATAGTDYTAGSGTLTFNTGDETKTITVTVTGDDADEPNETLTVTLTNESGATLGDATGTGTITDDDDAPTVTLVLTPDSIVENGGKSTVTATLDHPSSEATTVTVTFTPVDPALASDYTLSGSQLTIPAGETTSTGVVTITAVNNEVNALDKEVTVSATATNSQGITAPQAVTLTITDDDAPTLSIGDASVNEGDSGTSATLTFTVTLTPAATLPVTVDWATSDGTATAGTDYTAGSGTLTFNTGDETKTITVTVTGDDADEPNETLTVTLTNESGATLGDATGTGTITDDDDAPTVTLVLTPDSIVENGGKSTVTATLDHPSSEATTVTVTAAPVSPSVAGDYTLSTNKTLTIAAGQTTSTGVVTITAVNNEVDALDKEVTVSATAANDQGVTAPQDATLTITDDDAPTLSIGDASVNEGDSGTSATLTFTVTLSPAATLPVTVDWATSDGTATAGTDYTAGNGSLTFDTGDETKTITVTVTGDDADEPNETFTVTLSNAPGATITDATGTGTITDDDGPPAVTLALTPATIGENGGKSTVTATLDRASSVATTVTVAVTPKSPAVAGDYTLSTNKTLTIAADSLTSTGVVTITAVNNDVDALDKEVTVSATATNTQGVTAPDSVTLTIEDDDAPALSVGDASVAEGDLGKSATLTFTVTLSPAATLPVTVDWKTADGTATAGTDYTAANGSLTFNTGEDTKTVTVTVTGDDADEPNETLTLTLTNESGATIADATGTGTITDDDDAPTVTLVLTPASITENGGKSTVTATLDRPSSAATTVTVSAAPVSPAVAGDYTLTGSQLTIAAGETTSTGEVTITAVNNEVDALAKEVTVSATATNSQGITAPQDTTLTITDDDAPSLSIGDASVTEGDDGESPTLTFTVTLAPAATLPVTVDWATADGTAEAGTDYTAGNGTLTFEAGEESKSVTVTVTGDEADEPNETFAVTLSNAPGATLSDATATGTITDDDDAPTVTLVLTPASIGENGGKSTVTATLDRASSAATTVTVTAAPVTPAVAGDYALSANTTLTIPADSLTSTGVVTITAVNNEVDALDKEVTVSATATNSQGITAPQDATLTIEDDDAPGLSIGDASVDEGDDGESATLTFTVTLAPAATLPVTVDWKTADGTAEAGTDYTAGNGTLTFNTGDESKTVTVTVTGDDADEPNETLTVTLTNESGATLGDATATGTITDDDDAPTVTLVLTPASITENGGESTVTATLDRPSSAATTVTVSAAPVSPAVANDYTLSTNRTLTIPADSLTSTGVVTITAVNNEVDALDKQVTVSATAENDQGITAPQNATLTITDDDAPGLSIGDAGVDEGDAGGSATLTFTVTLAPAATLPVTVDWKTADGTAEAGTDYTAGNGTLTFNTGDESKTVTVTVTGDDADEPNETLMVTLSNAPGATLADATGTGTITDDDGPPAVTLVLTPALITENGGKSTVTATLDRASSEETTVTVSAEAVSPAVAGDYTLSADTTLTITAGATDSTGEVTITAADNTVYEGDKTVTVSATATNAQGVTAPQDATLTITEDDAVPVVTVAAETAEVTEGGDAAFILTRTGAGIATPLAVDFTLADPDAVLDREAPTTATIPANETTAKVTLATDDDATHEEDASLTLTLTDGDAYDLGSATSATVTVRDNDPQGQDKASDAAVTVAAETAEVTEGGDAVFTLTRTGDSTAELAVAFAVTGDLAALTDAPPTEATFAADADTVRVALATDDDTTDEPHATLTLTVTDGEDYYPGTPSEATVTVEDDDGPPTVTLVLTPASITENGGKSTVTATLDRPSSEETTVTVSAAPLSPAVANDYTLSTNRTLTIPADSLTSTGVVTITAVNNEVDALAKEVTVSATATNSQGITAPQDATLTIADDDAPSLSIGDASVDEGDAGGSATLTFTVTLDPAATLPVTVDWATSDGTATAGTDYMAGSGALTFETGDESKTITVTVTGDDADEPNETLTVTLSNESGATLADATATGTITDDDDAPTVTLALDPASITENGGKSTVTATLDHPSSAATTVSVTAVPVSPAVSGDYALTGSQLTIAAGETTSTGAVTITAVNNEVDALDKVVTVSATATNSQGITAPQDATLTIEDDDAPGLSIGDASVSEGDDGESATLTFTVTLDPAATLPVTVDWATSDGTAEAGTDYTAGSGSLRFDTGDETKTVTVTVTGDDADEPNETLTVTLSNESGATLGDATGTGTITDDDDAPTVTLVLTPATIGEAGGKSTVTATLDRASSAATTVRVTVAPVSPAVAGDYTLSTNKTLTIAAGQTTSTGVVTITAVSNEVDALDKEVTVSATATNSQGVTAPQDVTLTITDDDAPTLSIGDASVGEGDEGDSPTLTFTVTLSPAATLPVTVDWKTADGTATAGTDYTAANGSLTFNTGDKSKTVTVTVTGDDADEPNETFTVTLSNAPGATITDATGTGTITDDDGPPAVTLALTPATIGENGGKSTVTATLDRASSAATTVTVAVTPKSPAVAGDYTLSTNRTLTIAADSLTSTGVVTITAVNNDVDALDKVVTVSATATNTQGVTAPDSVTLTIEDDDAPALSVGDASVTEGDLGESATLTFTVTLSPAATLPVTVDWKTADGTATAGTDYTAANGSLTFNTGDKSKTVTVTVTGDDADEPNEVLTVTLSNAPGATITDATGTGTITDDDDAPTVTLVLTPASITEAGGKSTVTATLDRPSSAATTVTVTAAPVTPAVAGDYTLSTNKTLTIAAGQTTSTGVVTITAVNNDVDALDKEVTVSATAANDQGVTAPQNVTLTITDDDAPALSIGDASVTEGDAGESATLTFTVTLDPAATLPVTVDWATSDGTAEARNRLHGWEREPEVRHRR